MAIDSRFAPVPFVPVMTPQQVQALGEALAPLGKAAADLGSSATQKFSDFYSEAAKRATTSLIAPSSLSMGLKGASTLYGVTKLPGVFATAVKDFRDAVKNGNWGQAVQSGDAALRTTLTTAQGALSLGAMISEARRFAPLEKEAQAAIHTLLGGSSDASKALASYAAKQAALGLPLKDVDMLVSAAKGEMTALKGPMLLKPFEYVGNQFKAAKELTLPKMAADAFRDLGFESKAAKIEAGLAAKSTDLLKGADLLKGGSLVEEGAKVATKAAEELLPTAGKVGAEAGLKLAGEAGASTLAKAAGRFAPGVNIAIAGLDVATAAAAWANPNASIANKVTSTITAAGSIVAATDIPIVSQIGAAVSIGSSVVGGLIDSGIASKAVEGVAHVAEKAVEGVKDAGKAVGHFFKSLF